MEINLADLTKEVRDSTGIDLDTVRAYSRFMFKSVYDTMSKGDTESISLQYLGIFHCKPSRLKHLADKGEVLSEEALKKVEDYKRSRNENNRQLPTRS